MNGFSNWFFTWPAVLLFLAWVAAARLLIACAEKRQQKEHHR